MESLGSFLLPSSLSASGARVTFDQLSFGPRRMLTCGWFGKVVDSRVEQCRDVSGALLDPDADAAVPCVPLDCRQLQAAARRAAPGRRREPVEGGFAVRLIGRLSLDRRQPQQLGDSTGSVIL